MKHNRNNEISQRTQLTPGHATKLIDSLEWFGLVEQLRPVTASPRAKKTAYAIRDQFLRFHFRFIEPAKSQLRTSALAAAYLQETVLAEIDQHASHAWEGICREYVLHNASGVKSVGRWWGQVPTGDGRRTEEREIDVVGVDSDRKPVASGMCKWTAGEVDFDELNLLDRLTQRAEGHTGMEQRFLFSRSGFTNRLRSYAATDESVHLVTPEDIYQDG